jgi:hypothetical protein
VQGLCGNEPSAECFHRGRLENIQRFPLRDPWVRIDEAYFTDAVAQRQFLRERAADGTCSNHRYERHVAVFYWDDFIVCTRCTPRGARDRWVAWDRLRDRARPG